VSYSANLSLALLMLSVPNQAQADETATTLRDLHRLNQLAAKAGSLAQKKASREDVRSYGYRLMLDHRYSDRQVLRIAAELGVDVGTTKTDHDDPLVQDLAQLETLTGPAFDLAFIRTMRAMHTRAIEALTGSQRLLVRPLVRFLDRTVPILEQHVELAVHLAGGAEEHAER
jgi:putative membrane protein